MIDAPRGNQDGHTFFCTFTHSRLSFFAPAQGLHYVLSSQSIALFDERPPPSTKQQL